MTWAFAARFASAILGFAFGYYFGFRAGRTSGRKVAAADMFFDERRLHFKRTLQQWDDMLKQSPGNDDRPN